MEHTVSPEELKKWLDAGKVEFMFDLRNEEEFAAWRVGGRSDVETVNIPQIAFVGEEEKYLGEFPRDRRIVTICAHGDSSRYSAELLRSRGFDAVSLEGGMDSWSELYEPHLVSETPLVYQVYRVARGCMAYLAVSEGSAVVIDAGRHIDRVLDLASSRNATIVHVFDTHLQADHISGGLQIAQRAGCDYSMSSADAGPASFPYRDLKGGDVISFGKSRIEVIPSPGHTPGSTSLLLDDRFLFTGDTIMKTSIGRPDLGGRAEEWAALLYETLFKRFRRLGDDVVILPAHAASLREQDERGVVSLTLGESRRMSDLYQKRDYAEFLAYVQSSLPENPERYQEIRKVNLGLLDPDEAKRKELEIGKNLCGMEQRPA